MNFIFHNFEQCQCPNNTGKIFIALTLGMLEFIHEQTARMPHWCTPMTNATAKHFTKMKQH